MKFISNALERKFSIVSSLINQETSRKLLDYGCGEGWSLDFFHKKGWDLKGIEMSDYGLKTHNPHLLKYIEIVDNITDSNNFKVPTTFDLIILENVLEHVLNPLETLSLMRKFSHENTIIIIQVPNDFSITQQRLKQLKFINSNYWVAYPDHISYFNLKGLENLCYEAGWRLEKVSTDFPIDFSLFNENTNYINDKTKGKSCHYQRMQIDALIHSISIEKANQFYENLANIGLGRSIIGFFKPIE
jgi:2-polyprenyl-3-methyl-5-hydroxy-6-metoxy-1,4-benzoquinol methylase